MFRSQYLAVSVFFVYDEKYRSREIRHCLENHRNIVDVNLEVPFYQPQYEGILRSCRVDRHSH